MKKTIKIFGIGAILLMLVMTIIPSVSAGVEPCPDLDEDDLMERGLPRYFHRSLKSYTKYGTFKGLGTIHINQETGEWVIIAMEEDVGPSGTFYEIYYEVRSGKIDVTKGSY